MNVAVRRSPLLILGVAGLFLALDVHAQTSVATTPVGYNMLTLPAGNSVRVNTFVQPTAFQGVAASITSASNSVVTVSGTGSPFTSGSFAQTGAQPAYYMEILSSGSAQGLIVDILANTGNTVTVNANLPAFAVSGTTSFCIRPHTTLSSLFPATTTQLTAYADTIELFFPNGTNQLYLFTGAGDGWVNSGSGADAGGQVVYPGQGFVVGVGSAKTVPIMGYVKPGPTQVPVYPGAINLVGAVNPVLSGSQTLSSFAFPSSFARYADTAEVIQDTGLLQAQGLYLSSGTNMIDSGSGLNSDSVTVSPSQAVVVNVGQSKNLVLPSFYTSGN